jgi:hypothetical protein
MASQRRFKVLANYRDPDGFHPRRRDQFQPGEGNVYQKLHPSTICELMERADKSHNAAGLRNIVPPRHLYERMSNELWTCTATAHVTVPTAQSRTCARAAAGARWSAVLANRTLTSACALR